MAIVRTYLCPDCGGTFDLFHMSSAEPPPNFCLACGNNMSDEPGVVPGTKNISTARSKSIDGVYTAMEKGSEARMEAAAEIGGGSASDYSALKITDLKTNLVPGETAAVMPATHSQSLINQGVGGMQAQSSAVEFARQTRVGPYAGAGASTAANVRSMHGQMAANLTRAGNVGVYGKNG